MALIGRHIDFSEGHSPGQGRRRLWSSSVPTGLIYLIILYLLARAWVEAITLGLLLAVYCIINRSRVWELARRFRRSWAVWLTDMTVIVIALLALFRYLPWWIGWRLLLTALILLAYAIVLRALDIRSDIMLILSDDEEHSIFEIEEQLYVNAVLACIMLDMGGLLRSVRVEQENVGLAKIGYKLTQKGRELVKQWNSDAAS